MRQDTHDTTVKKIDSTHSPVSESGAKYLASGKSLAMRLWEKEPPADRKPASRREYETVGYVIAGRAELHVEGQMVLLEPGDSWLVPGCPTNHEGSSYTRRKHRRAPSRRTRTVTGRSCWCGPC